MFDENLSIVCFSCTKSYDASIVGETHAWRGSRGGEFVKMEGVVRHGGGGDQDATSPSFPPVGGRNAEYDDVYLNTFSKELAEVSHFSFLKCD